MQTRISRIFGSYDLFAKSFPGLIFLIFLVTLLPEQDIVLGDSFRNSTVLVYGLLAIVFGFAIGQALHSVAVDIEKGFYSFGRAYYRLLKELRYYYSYLFSSIPDRFSSDGENVTKGAEISKYKIIISFLTIFGWVIMVIFTILNGEWTTLLSFLLGIAMSVVIEVQQPREWFYRVLNPHRQTFDMELQKDNELVRRYTDRYREIFDDKDLVDDDGFDQELMYMMTMSYLENIGSTRSRQFQATFSFCRSIWVVLVGYAIMYLLISAGLIEDLLNLIYILQSSEDAISYTPMILSWTSQRGVFIISVAMLSFALWFMEGEKQYKSLFTKYVMVDFITTTNNDIGIQSDDPYNF